MNPLKKGKVSQGKHKRNDPDSQVYIRSTKEQMLYLIAFLLFVCISVFVDFGVSQDSTTDVMDFEDGWTSSQGQSVSLEDLPLGNLTLTKNMQGLLSPGKDLCFHSIDTFFDCYSDDELIYSYHPILPKRFGVSPGMNVHAISLPASTKVLKLVVEPAFSTAPAGFNNVSLEYGDKYMVSLFRNNLLSFLQTSITLIIGLFALMMGLSSALLIKSSHLDLISFGLMCVLLGISGYNDTLMLQVLTGHTALIRVVSYICLIFLPFPILSFIASATGNSHSPLVSAMLAASLTNFFLQLVFTCLGLSDYYHMVYISHGIILLVFFFAIILLIKALRKKAIQGELLHTLTAGLSVCILGAILDLYRYHFNQSFGATGYTKLGVFLFTLFMGVYLIREQTRALQKKQNENNIFIDEITKVIANIIDMKDAYTKGHSSRVAHYTVMLAQELGYDQETIDKYHRIALLHDVGKIGIPKEVLNKPGKLTDEEYVLIKSHTTKGYETLKDISIMPELAIGALSHHERPDGKGYPNGLKEGEIPRVAQIIAVADCFDAMYSDRPYRKRMNFEKAVSIITEVSGTQLAPDVVEAFLKLVDQGKFRDPSDDGSGSLENIDNIHKALNSEQD